MFKLLFTLCLSQLFLAATAWAEVNLQMPDDLKAVAVNGKEEGYFAKTRLQLPNGINQIAIRLQKEFGRSVDDTEMEYSDVFVIKFRAADESLRLYIPHIENKFDLERFNDNPDIRILNSSKTSTKTYVARLEKEGFLVMRNYEQELHVFNKSDSPAALKPNETQSKTPDQNRENTSKSTPSNTKTYTVHERPQQPTTGVGTPSPPQTKNMSEKMLKYWYEQADEATREKFKESINK
jgi:uncharacterized protein YccT (UPF0319 family)